jgi:fatty acid desaturase
METITLEKQEEMGLRNSREHYVPAVVNRQRELPTMPINAEIVHTIDAAPLATQHIEMKTSATDRAKGFLLASVPLCAAFACAVVAVVVFGFQVPLASLATLAIFLLMFVAAWVLGYTYTLTVSAEGVSLFEAKSKWDVIKEEQRRRWAHYEKLTGGDQE